MNDRFNDGRFSSSEAYRHQCEVRQVLRWRVESREKAVAYLAQVRERRGPAAADLLMDDVAAQWKKGNRGLNCDWK